MKKIFFLILLFLAFHAAVFAQAQPRSVAELIMADAGPDSSKSGFEAEKPVPQIATVALISGGLLAMAGLFHFHRSS